MSGYIKNLLTHWTVMSPGIEETVALALYSPTTKRGTLEGSRPSRDGLRRAEPDSVHAHQWGLVLHITGDPKRFGRVYVGTHGRGTWT